MDVYRTNMGGMDAEPKATGTVFTPFCGINSHSCIEIKVCLKF